MIPREVLSTAALRVACQRFSDGQIAPALDKYTGPTYIERDDISRVLDAFMEADQPALVIAGDVGVGKTNLLVHFYQHTLLTQPDLLPLWFDGASLSTERSLARTILLACNQYVALDPILAVQSEANRALSNLLYDTLKRETLVLVIDGANENDLPMEVFRVINDFIVEFPAIDYVKLIVTTRPQIWKYARTGRLRKRYKSHKYFSKLPDALNQTALRVENDSFVLTRYNDAELATAFEKYTAFYNVVDPDLARLSESLRRVIREPLLLRLTCTAHHHKRIPPDMQGDSIVSRLISSMVDDSQGSLRAVDLAFLRRWLMPQFFPPAAPPVARLTREMLKHAALDSGTLDDQVMQVIWAGDYDLVDSSVQRLIRSGWLLLKTSLDDYELRFCYEYFYDDFGGSYLMDQYQRSAERVAWFDKLITDSQSAAFLWGALRTFIINLLKNGEYDFIAWLGNTTNLYQYELVRDVLTDYYQYYPAYRAGLHRLLLSWLAEASGQSPTFAVSIAASVSAANPLQAEDILLRMMIHPDEPIRLLFIQNVYKLWHTDPVLTTRFLKHLANRITLLRMASNLDLLETLVRVSLMLALNDYVENGAAAQSPVVLQGIWTPIIQRLLLVSDIGVVESLMKRVRTQLLRFLGDQGVKMLRNTEREGFSFSFRDAMAYFPADDHKKQILMRIIPHLHAAAEPLSESVEALTDFMESLARQGDDNLVIVFCALTALIAHMHHDPLRTARAIEGFLDKLHDLYPPTTTVSQPTATIWYLLATYPFLNLRFEQFDMALTRELLNISIRLVYNREFRYRNRWRFSCGDVLRVNGIGELLYGYHFDIPKAGREALEKLIRFNLEQNDHEQIIWTPYSIAVGMNRYHVPNAGVQAFYDFIQLLWAEGYFEKLTPEQDHQFWVKAADDLIEYAGKYPEHLRDMVEVFEKDDLPQYFRDRLLRASQTIDVQASVNSSLGEAITWTIGRSLADRESPFARNIVVYFFERLSIVPSAKDLFYDLFAHIGELLYGEKTLFLNR